jgi:5-methylcytosine-specific restriction endonuclease McrA|tara:strand:- start:49 stop:339 length:291 start_codon:yes stop_codon:yes gene_type:complete
VRKKDPKKVAQGKKSAKNIKRNYKRNWKKKYKKYLLSDEWAQLKIDLFKYRGKECEKCGETKYLQVHHLSYKNIFHEEPEDLMILCKSCHRKEHNI